MLKSLVCQLPKDNALYDLSRCVIDQLISHPVNSANGIKLSIDKPLNNDECLNIHRPAVLRQYFGKEVSRTAETSIRYTYGSGSDTSSVGMDPHNFVTRSLSDEMICMIEDIHKMLTTSNTLLNMEGVDLISKFNHCTVLLYYAGEGLKKSTSLGYHTDCVYSPLTGDYISKNNSQKENTPAIIYSIGDKRTLNWKRRHVSANDNGGKVWSQSNDNTLTFELDSDTMTIIHPDDENPKSNRNKESMSQYMHDGVNITGETFSVGFVFRVVK